MPNDKNLQLILTIITGIIQSQRIIIQTLHESGVIDKQDIINALDIQIKAFKKNVTTQNIAHPMEGLRNFLEQNSTHPIKPTPDPNSPDWLRGIFEGGLPKNPGTDEH